MSTVATFLVGLALILPVTGYVVGSLVSSSSGEPERRDPVIVGNVPPPADDGSTGPGPGAGGDDGRDVDENGITVVTPAPSRAADGRDDDGDGGDDDGDGGDGGRDDRDETDDDGDGGEDDD